MRIKRNWITWRIYCLLNFVRLWRDLLGPDISMVDLYIGPRLAAQVAWNIWMKK